jgi:type 1 fimbria pilin
MNKHLSLLTAALLLAGASSAFAASSTDLTVTGLITPGACTPTLSNGGIADHGEIPSKDLALTSTTSLPRITLQLAVNCEAANMFALAPKDNRAGTAYGSGRFGIGKVDEQPLGGFLISMSNLMADGVAAQPLTSENGGNTWTTGGNLTPARIFGAGAVGGPNTLLAVKDLTSDLGVRTIIAPAEGLNLTNEVAIDGSVTLDIKYF